MNQVSVPHTPNTRAVSLRERSTSDLTQVIHLPGDEAAIRNRTRVVLGMYYEKDVTPEDKAEMIEEFVRALRAFPAWATSQAFDSWAKQMSRRPSPAEIANRAISALRPFTDEIARRKDLEALMREQEEQAARKPLTPEQEKRRLEAAKMADEAIRDMRQKQADILEQSRTPRVHWTETVPENHPHWDDLKRARSANKLMETEQ